MRHRHPAEIVQPFYVEMAPSRTERSRPLEPAAYVARTVAPTAPRPGRNSAPSLLPRQH